NALAHAATRVRARVRGSSGWTSRRRGDGRRADAGAAGIQDPLEVVDERGGVEDAVARVVDGPAERDLLVRRDGGLGLEPARRAVVAVAGRVRPEPGADEGEVAERAGELLPPCE